MTSTAIIFTAPDGAKFLRGLPGDPTDADLVDAAAKLGATSWVTLGVVSGPPDTKLTDVDYAPDGSRIRSVTRLLGGSR